MRISDWSSDVCSSDLRRRNVEQHHAATDAGFEVEIFVQLHVRPEIDELDAGVGRADTVDTPETLDDAHRIPRSEEHTSELQSLMRISYAVFCLKKKNTSKKQNDKQRSKTHSND